jgi:polysaccharide biosynthesis/export protein
MAISFREIQPKASEVTMSLFVSVLARRVWIAILVAGILPAATQAQSDRPSDSGQPGAQQAQPNASDANAAPDAAAAPSGRVQMSSPSSSTPIDMLIGPGDEGEMKVYGIPELSTHFRVESSGDTFLPLIGKFHMAGLSADAAQAQIDEKYESGGFLRNPHVNIVIKEYTTQGISVLGEVNHPGIYSALNARRLYDLFLIAGGLTARAGKTVTITHSKEPDKPVLVTLENGLAANQANVEIQPGDTINVSRAGTVYVLGEVNRPGAFVMETTQTPSLLQLLAAAAGPTRTAALSHTRLIRRTPHGLESKDVDLKKIMEAKAGDLEVQADDIVFVPSSRTKGMMPGGAGSMLGMLANLAIYRF